MYKFINVIRVTHSVADADIVGSLGWSCHRDSGAEPLMGKSGAKTASRDKYFCISDRVVYTF